MPPVETRMQCTPWADTRLLYTTPPSISHSLLPTVSVAVAAVCSGGGGVCLPEGASAYLEGVSAYLKGVSAYLKGGVYLPVGGVCQTSPRQTPPPLLHPLLPLKTLPCPHTSMLVNISRWNNHSRRRLLFTQWYNMNYSVRITIRFMAELHWEKDALEKFFNRYCFVSE